MPRPTSSLRRLVAGSNRAPPPSLHRPLLELPGAAVPFPLRLPPPSAPSHGGRPRPGSAAARAGVGQGQEGQPVSGSSPSLAPSPSRVSASCSRERRGLACFGLGLLAAAVVVLASSLHRTPVTILSFLLQSSTSPLRLSPSRTTSASSASPRRRSMLPLCRSELGGAIPPGARARRLCRLGTWPIRSKTWRHPRGTPVGDAAS
jgi:hypothetical protein